MNNVVSDLAGQ